ncbi:MAG TPA: glycosyltransferase [bacterium]|nr:glycosyltransferase [bacterium]
MTVFTPSDISVVLPVGNGSAVAGGVVRALVQASPPPGEVVVVDDRVSDGSLDGVKADGRVRVVRNDRGPGPAGARNAGAREARGPVILFVDADVFVPPDVFARIAAAYGEGVDGVVGVEAEVATLPNLASRYKNLWMRYTYLILPRRVDLFYTSCASIKKDSFLAAGGFDEGYAKPSVEDTAFGRTLAAHGIRIVLDKSVEVEHRKVYGGWGVPAAAFKRGAALARCILRMGRRPGSGGNRTSVPSSFIASVVAAALFPLWIAVAAFSWPWAVVGAAATWAAIYLLNIKWLAFLARRGVLLALWSSAFLPLEVVLSLAGGVWGTASYYLLGKRY